jgi:GTP diphosphokinase / guanosine-3',5'-bis(diphosphate) 3'-diphosphatase
VEDVYAAVGFGKLAPRQLLTALFPDQPPAAEQKKPSAIASVVNRVLGRADTPITVKGLGGLLVYCAKCCNPIRGDDIVGYITRGKGIAVHSTTCPNVAGMLGSDRLTEVRWTEGRSEDESYTVRLSISAEDRQGILADITSAVSNLKTNIRESRSSTDEGRGLVELTIDIRDVQHLQKVVRVLKAIRGIEAVDRVSRIP